LCMLYLVSSLLQIYRLNLASPIYPTSYYTPLVHPLLVPTQLQPPMQHNTCLRPCHVLDTTGHHTCKSTRHDSSHVIYTSCHHACNSTCLACKWASLPHTNRRVLHQKNHCCI
jgi:hypothetical protein